MHEPATNDSAIIGLLKYGQYGDIEGEDVDFRGDVAGEDVDFGGDVAGEGYDVNFGGDVDGEEPFNEADRLTMNLYSSGDPCLHFVDIQRGEILFLCLLDVSLNLTCPARAT